jgi:DNA repair exonuclease SbcCD ATPase subunit
LHHLQGEETEAARFAQAEEERAEAARQAVAVAASRATDASERLNRFRTAVGGAVCSVCLQPIDAEHAAREEATLVQALRDAETAAERCREECRTATEAATAARQIAGELESQRRQAAADRDNAAHNCRQADAQAGAARTAFENARAELSPELAALVAGIDTDRFPSRTNVAGAREIGRHLPARMRAAAALRTRRQDRDNYISAIATLEQAVRAVGAPMDVTEVRAELACGEQRLEELNRVHCEEEQARNNAEQAERELAEPIRHAASEVNRLAAAFGGAQANATNARSAYDEATQTLPNGAMEWDSEALAEDLRGLEEANVEDEFAAMAEDRVLQAERERQLAEAEGEIEKRVLPNARRPSSEVAPEIEAATQTVAVVQQAHETARDEFARLVRQREERETTQARLAAAACKHALHDRLADLLGPEGIQLDLVRQAERRIIELANEILGRVSCGELRFEAPDPAGTQAFDLSVRRIGCPEPIPVGNLSGGQRCRVAISLALAVCRFASGETQPLQSVIIDEAFANLDRDGRMAMIDVIRNGGVAGDILRRIIVVSHHEDVAAAFPVGYRLENDDGMTRAFPFGR